MVPKVVPTLFYPRFLVVQGLEQDKMAGTKWTDEEAVALINAYGERRVQEAIEGMVNNKEVHKEIQAIMKDQSNIDRTLKQIETKLKKLRSGYSKLKDRMKTSGAERPYFSSALSSVERAALSHWESLDRVLGTRPVNDPPAEHLFESEQSNVENPSDDNGITNEEDNDIPTARDAGASKENPKQIVKRPPRKKPRLVDALHQSNEQMEHLQKTLTNSVTTKDTRDSERKEDKEFFREMFSSLSQTMMGMTQLLVQMHNTGSGTTSQVPVYHTQQSQVPASNYFVPQQMLHPSSNPYSDWHTASPYSNGSTPSPFSVRTRSPSPCSSTQTSADFEHHELTGL